MSLFGTSPDDSALTQPPKTRSKQNSLFNDDQPEGVTSNSSLFDDNASGPSPWRFSTPKKADKGDIIKSLLEGVDIPETYIDAYDILLESGYKSESGKISLSGSKRIFEGSGLKAAEQDRILDLITGGQDYERGFGRSEFSVLLALIGLRQEKEEATLDGVDERRKSYICSRKFARELLKKLQIFLSQHCHSLNS